MHLTKCEEPFVHSSTLALIYLRLYLGETLFAHNNILSCRLSLKR